MTAPRLLTMVAAALLGSSALAATYTVKPGDSLYNISRAAGLEPDALMRLNRLNTTTLQVGQLLNLGGAGQATAPGRNHAPTPATGTAGTRTNAGAYIRTAASRFLNIRYLYGGIGGAGIDCSGYTRAVFSQLGVTLPRTARAQFGSGAPVSRGSLQTGDLVFFNTRGYGVSHVGIYLGDGTFANANSYTGRTVIESMTTPYWSSRYVGGRRVLRG